MAMVITHSHTGSLRKLTPSTSVCVSHFTLFMSLLSLPPLHLPCLGWWNWLSYIRPNNPCPRPSLAFFSSTQMHTHARAHTSVCPHSRTTSVCLTLLIKCFLLIQIRMIHHWWLCLGGGHKLIVMDVRLISKQWTKDYWHTHMLLMPQLK